MDEQNIIKQYEKHCVDEFNKLENITPDGSSNNNKKTEYHIKSLEILNRKYVDSANDILKAHKEISKSLRISLLEIAYKYISIILSRMIDETEKQRIPSVEIADANNINHREKVYKYRGGHTQRDLDAIVNNQIYAASKEELNAETELLFDDSNVRNILNSSNISDCFRDAFRKTYNSGINAINKNIGIYSLHESVKNEKMWVDYANGSTGFCIEYDKEAISKIGKFVNVSYVSEPPKLDIPVGCDILEKTQDFIIDIASKKPITWKGESEIRVIFYQSGLIDVPHDLITGIYFGRKTIQSDIDLIRKTLVGRDIKYYQMNLKQNSYELEYEEIINNEK